jgi:sec-independent protein translocase protein TatC
VPAADLAALAENQVLVISVALAGVVVLAVMAAIWRARKHRGGATLVNDNLEANRTASPGGSEDEGMTMLEHLEELRQRLIVSAVAFILGLIVTSVPLPPSWSQNLTWTVINLLISIVGHDRIQAIEPGEVFFTYFQLTMMLGVIISMPIIVYQAIAFIVPALYPEERKYLFMSVPGALFSFAVGALFGYFIVVPAALNFLIGFGGTTIDQKWRFSSYVDAVSTLIFWMGLSFQTPLAIFFLCKLRVLNVDRLKAMRKYALVGAFVIGALITPTPDPFNQTLVSVPLYLLFEIGLLLARLA